MIHTICQAFNQFPCLEKLKANLKDTVKDFLASHTQIPQNDKKRKLFKREKIVKIKIYTTREESS